MRSGYSVTVRAVEVDVFLTEEQYRAVEQVRGVPPGCYKGSAGYVFVCDNAEQSERLCSYLRAEKVPHTLTVDWAWARSRSRRRFGGPGHETLPSRRPGTNAP